MVDENTLIGLSRISSVGMAFLSGFVSNRFGTRATMIWVFFLTGAATLALGEFPLGIELTGGLILCGTGVAYFLKLPAKLFFPT